MWTIQPTDFIYPQTKVGSWNSLDHLSLARVEKKSEEGGAADPMANKTFVITAILVRLSSVFFFISAF
jgi:hypothetical protein